MNRFTKKKTYLIATAVVIIVEIILSRVDSLKGVDIKNLLETIVLVVTMIGIFAGTEETITEGNQPLNHPLPTVRRKTFYLLVSFESGIYGGAIAGVFSGVLIMLLVLATPQHPDVGDCLKIIPFCGIMGVLFGGLVHIGRKVLLESGWLSNAMANLAGCVLACIVAGGLSGMPGMWLFGENSFPFIGYGRIILASIVGSIGIITGSLLYDYNGKIKYIVFSVRRIQWSEEREVKMGWKATRVIFYILNTHVT